MMNNHRLGGSLPLNFCKVTFLFSISHNKACKNYKTSLKILKTDKIVIGSAHGTCEKDFISPDLLFF